MRINRKGVAVFVMIAMLSITHAKAQYIAGNTYSPYTMYGLGEMFVAGDAVSKSMGGIGIASRQSISPNVQNPAAFSGMSEKSVLFSIGLQANNNYLKEGGLTSSHNAFLLSNVNLQFRVAKGIGFGFSLSPYSSVGYRVKLQETDPNIIGNIGNVAYNYSGTGGASQLKAGFGFAITKDFSIGVNYIYYLGNITREFNSAITPFVPPFDYRNIYERRDLLINHSSFEVGLQYMFKTSETSYITIGAVYQPHIKSKANVTQYVESYASNLLDTVKYSTGNTPMRFPAKYGGGILYETPKMKLGIDYVYQSYKDALTEYNTTAKVSYSASHDLKVGFEYIPNRFDVRSQMKRWSYRLGARYGRSYLVYDGKPLDEVALTLGFGVPLQKDGFTQMNIGAEVGRSGLASGQISNTYFRIFGGFNFFTMGEWFKRHKFR